MLSKRSIAIVAVLALGLPALGAAAPIVQPPVPERLVEGHTVFTVITQVNPGTQTNTSRFAAAAAVLVREYNQIRANGVRFPGVLWFNDQYLVDPSNSPGTQQASYRFPCGGAVMAVNAGDGDPRVTLVRGQGGQDMVSQEFEIVSGSGGQVPPDAPNGTVDLQTSRLEGGLPLSQFDYKESYLVTDPNDHTWVIDMYRHITTVAIGGTLQSSSTPVWVVNILGHPGFRPDDGSTSCDPFSDLTVLPRVNVPFVGWTPGFADMSAYRPCGEYDTTPNYQHSYACGTRSEHTDEHNQGVGATTGGTSEGSLSRSAACTEGNATGISPDGNALGTYRDNPCHGYDEPTTTGYCYDGNPQSSHGPCDDEALHPVRAYNALLYFKLSDLTRYAGNVNHAPGNTDTNGCQEQTEWACPNDDDHKEGNSHPFNPKWTQNSDTAADRANPETAQKCPYGRVGQSPYALVPNNHGGSGMQYTTGYGNYCDDLHATFDVQIYFSPTGRPTEPPARDFAITDVEGSSAPYEGPGTANTSDSLPGALEPSAST